MANTEKQPEGVKRRPRDKDKPHEIYRVKTKEVLGRTRKDEHGRWEVSREGEDEWFPVDPRTHAPHTSAMFWLAGDERFRIDDGFIVGSLGSTDLSEEEEAAETAAWIAANKRAAGKGQGFAVLQEAKEEVERLAMEAAESHYVNEGWENVDPEAHKYNPFDLVFRRDGQIKHVEVKGTTGKGSEIFLTAGEVNHARKCSADEPCQSISLFILSDIEIHYNDAGKPEARQTSKTAQHIYENIDQDRLKAITYRYPVP
jgi:hypothetical protein